MYGKMKEFLTQELADIQAAGLYKNERIITTEQRAAIKVRAQLLCQQLPGLVKQPAPDHCRYRCDEDTRLRHVERALHLWHAGPAQGTGGCYRRLLPHR